MQAPKCVPCESMDKSSLLAAEEVRERLAELCPSWAVDGDRLRRSFDAKDFVAALAFVNAAGGIAEAMGHHPDLHITSYRSVAIEVYTHSVGGITANDFELAAALDGIPVQYSPKWLREHPSTRAGVGLITTA